MNRRIRIVMALNYYAPYVSGLTEAARLVAEELARRGHQVVVVASRHDKTLPLTEERAGVRIIRTPVLARIGKGVVSPSFATTVARVARDADVVNLHLPMLDSGLLALLVRGTPIVATYQCDIALPAGLVSRFQSAAMDKSNGMALRRAAAIVPSSLDYARASRLNDLMSDDRTQEIAPPTRLLADGLPTFRETDGLHIGFLGRVVEEKGIEYLVTGFRNFDDPNARLLIAGDYSSIAGGGVIDRVREAIGSDSRIRVLGFLSEEKLPDFYASLDLFSLTSVNSFEAFGIAQVEAMKRGTPSLASDLPGVRVPVERTGFGRVVPARDAEAITNVLREFSATRPDTVAGATAANNEYGLAQTTDAYEALFEKLASQPPRRHKE